MSKRESLPDTDSGQVKADAETAAQAGARETRTIQLRHKTQYPKYRCAGLVLTQKSETYRVNEAQLERLRRDPWVVIAADGGDGKST
jgi:hypothetical protein